jgi:hypothetical protein
LAELLSLPNSAGGLNLSPRRKREMLLQGIAASVSSPPWRVDDQY